MAENNAITRLFNELFSEDNREALIDVTEWGRDVGFVVPVAFTETLWKAICDIPNKWQTFHSVRVRAHDVLFLAAHALREGERRGLRGNYFSVWLPRPSQLTEESRLEVTSYESDSGETVVIVGFHTDF